MTVVHTAAQVGFSTQAGTYTQGRPDYPNEISTWLRETLGISPASTVIDLGAGTGKFTRLLKPLSEHLTAIEPVDAMRQEFSTLLPDTRILPGTAQSMPLADDEADVLVCAQAFHWFAQQAALSEIHRVLKPGGRLLVLEFSKPTNKVMSKVYDAYSFAFMPLAGKLITNDSESYRYLAESIRMHPDQETLKSMMVEAGFDRVTYHNMTSGIVALHRGIKP